MVMTAMSDLDMSEIVWWIEQVLIAGVVIVWLSPLMQMAERRGYVPTYWAVILLIGSACTQVIFLAMFLLVGWFGLSAQTGMSQWALALFTMCFITGTIYDLVMINRMRQRGKRKKERLVASGDLAMVNHPAFMPMLRAGIMAWEKDHGHDQLTGMAAAGKMVNGTTIVDQADSRKLMYMVVNTAALDDPSLLVAKQNVMLWQNIRLEIVLNDEVKPDMVKIVHADSPLAMRGMLMSAKDTGSTGSKGTANA
jgi:protein-S-isoprenylcysteine O-methyltransferase Ste14